MSADGATHSLAGARGVAASRSHIDARRVLLLGASGRLGAAISGALSVCEAVCLISPTRRELDFDLAAANPDNIAALDQAVARWFANWRPDVVVNCIAMSDVDRCERKPKAAWQLNAELPGALARTGQASVRLIHFSTDFVFDGDPGPAPDQGFDARCDDTRDGAARRPYREDDATRPLSVYGSTKLAGEHAITDSGCRYWIFRVSWLYGSPSRNLAARLLDPASGGQAIPLSVDRIGVPNPVGLLAGEIAACLMSGDRASLAEAHSGLYHLSCRGCTTWYEFGVEFVRQAIAAGRISADRPPRLEAIDEARLQRPAPRPRWSPLDPGLYERTFRRTMPHWRDAIGAVLRKGPM